MIKDNDLLEETAYLLAELSVSPWEFVLWEKLLPEMNKEKLNELLSLVQRATERRERYNDDLDVLMSSFREEREQMVSFLQSVKSKIANELVQRILKPEEAAETEEMRMVEESDISPEDIAGYFSIFQLEVYKEAIERNDEVSAEEKQTILEYLSEVQKIKHKFMVENPLYVEAVKCLAGGIAALEELKDTLSTNS